MADCGITPDGAVAERKIGVVTATYASTTLDTAHRVICYRAVGQRRTRVVGAV